MKRLRMKTLYCTPQRAVQPDQVAMFEDEEAEVLVEGGYAFYVEEDPSTGGKRRPAEQVKADTDKTAPEAPAPQKLSRAEAKALREQAEAERLAAEQTDAERAAAEKGDGK